MAESTPPELVDFLLILFGIAVGWVARWAFTPPCPKFKPKYWERDE